MLKTNPTAVNSVFILVLALLPAATLAGATSISGVELSKSFFNPSIGEAIEIRFISPADGTLSLLLLDRDGYVARTLAANKSIRSGSNSIRWDGRDDNGKVVPDEAYSLKIDIGGTNKTFTYFPAQNQLKEIQAELGYYDRQNRVLSYKLPKAARVHIQSGSAVIDPKTGKGTGPVLKTVANREPRVAGAIVEHWNGFDESGTIYVPDLPNFVFSIFATELPENSILCVGNRATSFVNTVGTRKGLSLLKFSSNNHQHHRNLATLDDVSPSILLRPANAVWSQKEGAWLVQDPSLKISGQLEGPSSASFAKQPGSLGVFVNETMVSKIESPKSVFHLNVGLNTLSAGVHYVAVNWGSEFGPVAVSAFRIKIPGKIARLDRRGKDGAVR